MLIDASYFTAGTRYIHNATYGTQSQEVNDTIMGYVAHYQQQFLVDLLGDKVGNELHSYLMAKDEGDFEPDEALDELCKHIDQAFADFVYYQIVRANNSHATIRGVVRFKSGDNYVSPMERQIIAWNGMVKRNRAFVQWLSDADCPIKGVTIANKLLTCINSFNL